MRFEVVNKIESFLEMREQWNSLVDQDQNARLFLRHEWLSTWLHHYGSNLELRIVIAQHKGELIGLFPFYLGREEKFGRTWPVLTYLQNSYTPEADFIILAAERERVLREFLDWATHPNVEWCYLRVSEFRQNSVNYPLLQNAIRKLGLRAIENYYSSAPCIDIQGEWSSYLSSRSRNFRKHMKKKLNKAKRDSNLVLRLIRTVEDFDQVYTRLVAISQASWQGKAGSGTFSTKTNAAFYRDLAIESADKDWLRIFLLETAEIPIGYLYCLIYNGEMFILKYEFDQAFGNLSPGSLTHYAALEYAWQNGVLRCNQGSPSKPHKEKWANCAETHSALEIFRRGLLGSCHFLWPQGGKEIAKRLLGRDELTCYY